jgi:hypothetical protein
VTRRPVRGGVARLRGARWAAGALSCTRRELRLRPLPEVAVPAPTVVLSSAGTRGVRAMLWVRRASCLERSLVLQRWLAAHGDRRDVIIGVCGPDEFRAHAWLEGEPAPVEQGFRELTRLAP